MPQRDLGEKHAMVSINRSARRRTAAAETATVIGRRGRHFQAV